MAKQKILIALTVDEEQSDVLNVLVPSLPGCCTWGRGKQEALEHAKEAIELYLKDDDIKITETEIVEIEVDR